MEIHSSIVVKPFLPLENTIRSDFLHFVGVPLGTFFKRVFHRGKTDQMTGRKTNLCCYYGPEAHNKRHLPVPLLLKYWARGPDILISFAPQSRAYGPSCYRTSSNSFSFWLRNLIGMAAGLRPADNILRFAASCYASTATLRFALIKVLAPWCYKKIRKPKVFLFSMLTIKNLKYKDPVGSLFQFLIVDKTKGNRS